MHDSVCMWKIGDVNIRESINVGEVLRFENHVLIKRDTHIYSALSTEFNKIYVPNTNKQKQKRKKNTKLCCGRKLLRSVVKDEPTNVLFFL